MCPDNRFDCRAAGYGVLMITTKAGRVHREDAKRAKVAKRSVGGACPDNRFDCRAMGYGSFLFNTKWGAVVSPQA